MSSVHEREGAAHLSLDLLQALRDEVRIAMSAIARNGLAEFEESVSRQQRLSDGLAVQMKSALEQASPGMVLRLQQAVAAMQAVHLEYDSLLQRSGRSAAQLAALCRCHTGTAQKDSGIGWKQQTWSCEV